MCDCEDFEEVEPIDIDALTFEEIERLSSNSTVNGDDAPVTMDDLARIFHR